MQPEVLRELQKRGRFFYEMVPGAKVSDEWQRHRDELEERELATSSLSPKATGDLQEGSAART